MDQDEFIEYVNNKKNLNKIFIHKNKDTFSERLSNYFDDEVILSKIKGTLDENSLYPILNTTRVIKSEDELYCMREIC